MAAQTVVIQVNTAARTASKGDGLMFEYIASPNPEVSVSRCGEIDLSGCKKGIVTLIFKLDSNPVNWSDAANSPTLQKKFAPDPAGNGTNALLLFDDTGKQKPNSDKHFTGFKLSPDGKELTIQSSDRNNKYYTYVLALLISNSAEQINAKDDPMIKNGGNYISISSILSLPSALLGAGLILLGALAGFLLRSY